MEQSLHRTYIATTPASWTSTPTLSQEPSYEFRSTSSCAPVVGTTSYTAPVSAPGSYAPVGRIRRDSWDTPDDLGIGELDDPAPIGGTPWILMFLMAALFALRAKRKMHKTQE